MSDRIASWWVVKRATEWDGISTVRHFLVPYSIPVPEEEDPVEDVLWETADAAIPAGLSFPNQQKDSMSHTAVFAIDAKGKLQAASSPPSPTTTPTLLHLLAEDVRKVAWGWAADHLPMPTDVEIDKKGRTWPRAWLSREPLQGAAPIRTEVEELLKRLLRFGSDYLLFDTLTTGEVAAAIRSANENWFTYQQAWQRAADRADETDRKARASLREANERAAKAEKELTTAKIRMAQLECACEPVACGVCGGKPLKSGKPCICKGYGTEQAEMQGLRELAFEQSEEIESLRASFASLSSEIAKLQRYTTREWNPKAEGGGWVIVPHADGDFIRRRELMESLSRYSPSVSPEPQKNDTNG